MSALLLALAGTDVRALLTVAVECVSCRAMHVLVVFKGGRAHCSHCAAKATRVLARAEWEAAREPARASAEVAR